MLSPRVILGTLAVGLFAAHLSAQGSVRTASCRQNVDSLQHRIELNYAGFLLEVKDAKRQALADTLAALENVADRTASADCVPVLNTLIAWYHDPHLFLYQADVTDTTDAARRKGAVRTRALSEAAARSYLTNNRSRLDPIEGLWYDLNLRVAIVPAPGQPSGHFEAVVLQSDTASWKPGDVRAQFIRRPDGEYDVTIWSRAKSVKELRGVVYKRVMLRMSPGIWGKEFPVAAADGGLLNPVDPHRATLQLRGRTVVLSIPSHDPTYRSTLDSLLAQNDSALRHAERLIVDVRGNEGGSSGVTRALEPFIVTNPTRLSPYPSGNAVILSSPNQINYAKASFVGPKGIDSSPALQRLLARMEANPGKLVPLSDSLDEPDPPRPAPVFGPRTVAVMIDHGTVSASEVLVLTALESTRTTVIGQPTEGALDYQSANIVYFSALERRWGLGYPTITRSSSLPLHGMRGIGIKPDVTADWQRIDDPISFVDAFLAKRN